MTSELDETADAGGVRPSGALVAGGALGKYRLVRVLGSGGMGVVWAAHDPDLDRNVAIKVLRAADAGVELRARLLREARAMARLKHHNVLTVYEVGTDGDRDFIAMELVDGASLDVWLSSSPPRDEVWRAIIDAGRGLAAAHAAGLVHRDFKPHNVLRSHDGRVLVTDFGLARGLGEAHAIAVEHVASPVALDVTADATSPPGRRSDDVLASPLTHTGALIGTPAYMAPEQFAGASPDPRTDQFAFCITAWQALVGERPFQGASVDELRRATLHGVTGVPAKLPRAIRAALVRGLDPDPAKRWPDLDALLDALERTVRVRRWRNAMAWSAVTAVAIFFAIAGIGWAIGSKAPPSCEPAEQLFADAWSPALRAKLGASDRVAAALDDYRARWIASYAETCRAPTAKLFRARVDCLTALRDRLSVVVQVLPATGGLDPAMLPNVALCNGSSPVVLPALPLEPTRRARIVAVIASTTGLRALDDDRLADALDQLEREATAIGWPPLVPMIRAGGANAYLARGELAPARRLFGRAVAGAIETHDAALLATIRLGLLEASAIELEHPNDDHAPKALPDELVGLITYAHSAVHAAGDDPMQVAALALLEARIEADHARTRSAGKHSYSEGLALAASARIQLAAAGDVRRMAIAAALEARIHLESGADTALDDALFAARSADDALERAQLGHVAELDAIRATVALARGDFVEARARFARITPAPPALPPGLPVHTGRVVDRDGTPLVAATVVAWTGELVGDPEQLFTDPAGVHGEIATTDRDGAFAIHAAPGAAIVAQATGRRSTPQLVGAGPLVIRAVPTTAVVGLVDTIRAFDVAAFVRFDAGAASWSVRAPIEKDRTYHVGGLPPGSSTIGVTGPAGDATRRSLAAPGSTQLRWPSGDTLELVVHAAAFDDDATVWVFRGKVAPASRADALALAAHAPEVATAPLHRIGGDASDAARELYRPGDRHAYITGNAAGAVTACAAVGERLACKGLGVAKSPAEPDSRTIPILLEL